MDESFWDSHGNEIEAAIILISAVVLALLVDRFLLGRADRATEAMETSQFSREARTRLRLARRLVFVAIIVIGVALALAQFTEIRRLATALLASTALLGLIIGFAAQAVIANFVAGVLMAIRQPIRIGDLISLGEDVHGRVADIALTYTSVDRGDGSLLVIPNAKVINEVVRNHSSGNSRAPVTAELWLRPDADLDAARKALEGSEVTGLRLEELTAEGARSRSRRRSSPDATARPARPTSASGRTRPFARPGSCARLNPALYPVCLYECPFQAQAQAHQPQAQSLPTRIGGARGERCAGGDDPRQLRDQRRRRRAPDLAAARHRPGLQLHRLRGRRIAAGLHPVRRGAHPGRDREDPRGPAAGHGRDRGRALLRAQRRRPRGHHPRGLREPRGRRGEAGRLDDHDAARPQPLHRRPRARPGAQDQGGEDRRGARGGALKGLDPRELPEHRLLRDRQRPHRGRGRGGGPDLLLEEGRQPRPGRVGDARRAAPVAVALQPAAEPDGRRSSAATRCSRRWRSRTTSPSPRYEDAIDRADRAQPRQPLRARSASPTSSTSSSSS